MREFCKMSFNCGVLCKKLKQSAKGKLTMKGHVTDLDQYTAAMFWACNYIVYTYVYTCIYIYAVLQ